jgi:hypothetical protein
MMKNLFIYILISLYIISLSIYNLLTFVTTWIDLEDVTLSDIR